MNREEMLKELKTIDLRAIPTVATMDMGLQYDYATSEGAGTSFGGMGDWPAYMFNPIQKEQWLRIREAIKENALAVSDLKGTGLDVFLGNVKTISDEDKVIPSEVLKGLMTLPEDHADAFFCMFDAGLWYDKYADKPEFFTSEKEPKESFINRYAKGTIRISFGRDNMNIEKVKGYHCPVEAAMDVIGGKYKALIVYELMSGTKRYHEIARAVPQATPRMLSKQLKELEEDGVISRMMYPVVPPKTEYSLTETGQTLVPIVDALCKWGEHYFELAGVPVPCEG